MKKIIALIILMLIISVMLLVGCTSDAAVAITEAPATPTATTMSTATPSATPDIESAPIQAVLSDILPNEVDGTDDTAKVTVPDAYKAVKDTDETILPEKIQFTVYSFIDTDGNTQYRAFGYRTGTDGTIYDIGFYEITIIHPDEAETEDLTTSASAMATNEPMVYITGKNGVIVMFDPVKAKPVDLETESETYATEEKGMQDNSKTEDNTGSSTNSGSKNGTETGSGSGGSNPTPTQTPTPTPAPTQAPTPTPAPTQAPTPAPTTAPAPGEPGYLPPVDTTPPTGTPPPPDWGDQPPDSRDF